MDGWMDGSKRTRMNGCRDASMGVWMFGRFADEHVECVAARRTSSLPSIAVNVS